VHITPVGLAHAHVDRAFERVRQVHAGRHLEAVGRRQHRQLRHGACAGDVFGGLVAGAQGAVDKTGTIAQKDHRQMIVRHVQLDLFQHAHRHKGRQAVDKGPEARARQACGHAHHVLLGNAGVDELIRAVLADAVEELVAVVAGDQQHARVLLRQAHQGVGEGFSHAASRPAATVAIASAKVCSLSRV
jgi:hypothetical protein